MGDDAVGDSVIVDGDVGIGVIGISSSHSGGGVVGTTIFESYYSSLISNMTFKLPTHRR